jgi:hypothetical protein
MAIPMVPADHHTQAIGSFIMRGIREMRYFGYKILHP